VIRATHVRYLNDMSEIRIAFSHENTDALLGELFPPLGHQETVPLRELMVPDESKYDAFIVSFTDDAAVPESKPSKLGDRLSQWRGYSNAAGGFSLGFDPELIMNGWDECLLNGAGSMCYLLRCKYSQKEKNEVAKNVGKTRSEDFKPVLEQYTALFQKENGRLPNPDETDHLQKRAISRVLSVAFTDYYLRAAGFKDDSFSEEVEWRIVFHAVREKLVEKQTSNPNVPILHFRPGRSGATPYIEFPLDLTSPKSPLRRIVAGPSSNKDEALSAIKLLLTSNGIALKTESGLEGVEVVGSRIPYRV